ncbi:hypothetical protein FEM48_Zijuj12G0106400 [Ziziphus jujuba var. spinosa]|uniref:NAC domain-containing protein n=1 Tax=Ziziphus jujuba var. spinosa TaxID=714518 RepID=A0A978UCU4_ZIZJJ|nr:hypothetical protein FEM48_Zijuj12G0106400 [Ziziphus jujuba var. spinosa]
MNFNHFDNGDAHLPPGFRFHPTDEELITYYLLKKVLDSSFTGRAIAEVDLNKCEPWELPEKAKMGEKEWYFFSLRDRKYPTGLRTNRATEAGYWKATGKDREIYSSKTCSLVGMKKTLVFYRGRAPKGEKSNWVMHEYRLEGKFAYHYLSRSSKDEWVISRVFQKSGSGNGSTTNNGGGGSKKTRLMSSSGSVSLFPEPSSPSSLSLPPLLDSSPYQTNSTTTTNNNNNNNNNNNASATLTDRDNCSYDSPKPNEHVSCFSTIATNGNFNLNFDIPPQPQPPIFDPSSSLSSRFSRNVNGVSAFPSLRSLQENLYLPFFPSDIHIPAGIGGGIEIVDCDSTVNWPPPPPPPPEESSRHLGSSEFECMWSY